MKTIYRILLAIVAVSFAFVACDKLEEPYIEGADTENDIILFRVDTIVGDIDYDAKTVTLTFPKGTDLTRLTPTISVSMYATVEPASGVAQDFTNPVVYTVTAFNGEKAQYTVSALHDDFEDAKKILSFGFEDLLAYGAIFADNTIEIEVPAGTDITCLAPTVEVSEGATLSPESGVAQDFSKPVVYTVTAINGTTAAYTIYVDFPMELQGKTGVLKDFTGVRCVNCPEASELAHSLQAMYEDRLILLSVHAGFLAQPVGSFPDFLTPEGNAWYGSNNSNPLGCVDRVNLSDGYTLNSSQWEDAVNEAFGQEQGVELKIRNDYNAATRQLKTVVKAKQFTEFSGDLYLTVCLVEDSIVAPQITGAGLNSEYVHRHVFRGTLDGEAYGSNFVFDAEGKMRKSYTFNVPATFNAEHCHIVAYISDESQVILQTAEKHF